MKNYQCTCGNRLFFENSKCLGCGAETGFCPACQSIAPLVPRPDGTFRCGQADCGASLSKCFNYSQYDVCNRCVVITDQTLQPVESTLNPPPVAGDAVPRPASEQPPVPPAAEPLCDCCRFNRTIPDLTVAGNQQKWARLEAAKRRLFYDLNLLKLPYGTPEDGVACALSFDFIGDILRAKAGATNNHWHTLTEVEKVYTGHDGGNITINICEADDVEREKARVTLGEPQRTLLGHFRHEIGHYFWDLLVKDKCEAECIAVFGDHNNPEYGAALDAYYKTGPKPDWSSSYISAYATMHPWEDFAETFAMYLNIIGELDTAFHVGFLIQDVRLDSDLPMMVVEFQKLGLALNEMNRSVGLMDAIPKAIVAPVVQKLSFIHQLIQQNQIESKPVVADQVPPPLVQLNQTKDDELEPEPEQAAQSFVPVSVAELSQQPVSV